MRGPGFRQDEGLPALACPGKELGRGWEGGGTPRCSPGSPLGAPRCITRGDGAHRGQAAPVERRGGVSAPGVRL